MAFKWRKYNRLIHRDLGYLTFGLIIIYSISGIAVNHINEWNPNYVITNDTLTTTIFADTAKTSDVFNTVINEIGISDSVNGMFRKSPQHLDIFFDGKTAIVNLVEGKTIIEKVSNRTVFRESNFLHLNAPKKAWTYIADGFAVALIFLAISGLFMINNKQNGIKGRGKYLVGIGILIPVIFLILYFY